MIINGNKQKITNTNAALPNMSNTILNWFLNITFEIVHKELDGADWVEGEKEFIKTKGVVQPPRDEDLKIFPEGTWAWEWLLIHCLPDIDLEVHQYIIYDGKKYKVMYKKDFKKYGYIRYTILEAYRADSL